MENLIAFFNKTDSLSENTLNLMSDFFVYDELKKGKYFIREGQFAKEIAFLETGIARAYYINKSGKEYNKQFFSSPSIIGAYASLISKQTNNIAQQALTDCTIWRAPYSKLKNYLKETMKLKG